MAVSHYPYFGVLFIQTQHQIYKILLKSYEKTYRLEVNLLLNVSLYAYFQKDKPIKMHVIYDSLVLYQDESEKVLRITKVFYYFDNSKKFLETWEKIEPGSNIAYHLYLNMTFFRTKADYVYFIDENKLGIRVLDAFTYLGRTDRTGSELMMASENYLYILSSFVLYQYNLETWPLITSGDSCKSKCIKKDCKTCDYSAEKNCVACKSGTYYNEGECVSQCPYDKFLSNKSNTCCPENCVNCINSFSCSFCKRGFSINYTSGLVNPRGGCVRCPAGCHGCADAKPCAECNNEYVLSADNCNKSQCYNFMGMYYNNKSGSCKNCPEGCESCLNSTFCESCKESFYLLKGTCRSCKIKDCENCYSELKCFKCSASEIQHEPVSDCEPYQNFEPNQIFDWNANESQSKNSEISGINLGANLGIKIGSIFFLVIIVILIILYRKKIKNVKSQHKKVFRPFEDDGINLDQKGNIIIKNKI
jgi:hypothetical protein